MALPPRLLSAGLLACYWLLIAVAATPIPASKCTVGCHGMQSDQSYKDGQIYTYALEGTTVSSVSEGQGEATLKLKADVELHVRPDCVRQVRLKNVQVNGAALAEQDVEKHALQFNYHHGHIDTELCAEDGDSQASLNIKRAVISLFQSSVVQEEGSATRHEVDVLGGCVTDFSFFKEGESQVVHKSRNLNNCANREHFNYGLFSASVNPSAGMQSSPLLGAEQKVEQRFKSGVLEKAVSTETYRLRPFSNGEAAAKTVVETLLTLTGKKEGASAAPVSQPKSLVFEAPHPVARSSVEAIEKALQPIHSAGHAVRPEAARQFSELVRVLRASSKKDILTVYHRVKAGAGYDKERDKKLLLDALYRAGTGEAAEVVLELIKNKEIGELQANLYYASLAFVQHVNLPAVSAAAGLLDQQQPPLSRLGYLGVGQIIGRYCSQHRCEGVAEVQKALGKLVAVVGEGKPADRAAEDSAVAALKALGNAKYLDEGSLGKLAGVAGDRKVRRRLRVAAIEALPARCAMSWKKVLFGLLADVHEDSEIRIKVYLALVACPCNEAVNKLREVLDSEKSYQFGSFVSSHLRNLRASAEPGREAARAYFGQIRPRAKFPEDVRKYSFNAELSYGLEAFGLGSSAESNVIYSQDSFAPRSVSLNLTGELFGHAFNFLEIDARAENLDLVLEELFGPRGLVPSQKPEEYSAAGLAKYAKERYYEAASKKQKRGKRDVKLAEIEQFGKGVELRADDELGHGTGLELDLSAKLFGAELGFLSYHQAEGHAYKASANELFERLSRLLKQDIKSLEHELESHAHILDVELAYPTGLGVAIGLGLSGSGVARAKLSTKIDLSAILADPGNAAFKVAVQPSASVELVGKLGVSDGFGNEAGLRLVGSLHTATGYDLSVQVLNDARGVDLSLGMPKKKQEIVSLSSDVYVQTQSVGGGQQLAPVKFDKGNKRSDCFDQFTAPLGLTVCGRLAYPYDSVAALQRRPLFPLSGPFKLELSVEANDVSSYHFRALYDDKKPDERSLELLLETPNSRTSRYVSLTARGALGDEPRLKLALDSPVKRATAEAVVKRNDKEQSFGLRLTNDQAEYYARAGVEALGPNKYKPVLEYKLPEHLERLAGGKQPGQSHQVEGTVEVSSEAPGTRKYAFKAVKLVSNGKRIIGLDGSAGFGPKSVDVDLSLGYAADDKLELKLDGKRHGDVHYSLWASASPSRSPASSVGLDWEYKREKGLFEHRLGLVQGADLKSKEDRLELEQRAKYSLEPGKLAVLGTGKLSYPRIGLLGRLEGALAAKSLRAEAELKYDKFRLAGELGGEVDQKQPGDYEVLLKAELLENKVRLESRRVVVDAAKSKFENSLKLTPGGTYKADASVKWQVKRDDVAVAVEADLDLNGKPHVRVDAGLECNPERLDNRLQLYVNKEKYVDYSLKVQRPAGSGDLGLALKNYLQAAGQFSYQNGKGSASLSVEVPKVGRRVKGSGEFSVSGTRHQASFELDYDDKEPAKKIKLTTDSDLSSASLDSKNTLEIGTYKTELRLRGKRSGELVLNGQQEAELELTLPNGRSFLAKGNRVVSKRDGRLDGKLHLELADSASRKSGGETHKIIADGSTSLRSAKDYLFETAYELKYVRHDGKELLYKLGIKNLPRDEDATKKRAALELAVSGNLLPYAANANATLDYDDESVVFRGSGSRGDDLSIMSIVKFSRGNNVDKPATFKGLVEAKLPHDKLKNILFEFDESVLDELDENGILECTKVKTLTYNGDKKIKFDSHYKHKGSQGLGKFQRSLTNSLKILEKPTLTVKENYEHDLTADVKNVNEKASVQYGDKAASVDVALRWRPNFETVSLKGNLATPFEALKHIDLDIEHKRENEKSRKTESAITIDGKKYTQLFEIELGEAPGIHLLFTCPAGTTELLTKFKKVGDNEYSGDYKLKIPQGFVTVDGRVKLESVDDFVINVNFDSDLAKYRKVHAEIANKLSSQDGRRIFITVTSDGKNLVTGSTNYKRHEEDKQVTLEGNGNLKIGENSKSSSFKYVRKQLTREADKEVGVGIMLNASFGPSAVVGELKLSDKEFHVFNSYCEQSKDCAHFKLQSTLDTDKLTHLAHSLQVEVNLKKFNVPVEFGLLSNTKYADYSLDHQANLYLHSTKDRTQYSYHLYFNKRESAIVLALPSREVAVVAFHDIPAMKHSGAYKIDISLFLDRKNKPAEKTSLILAGNVNVNKNAVEVNGEAKFVYPSQTKDMLVKGKVFVGGDQLLDANFDIDVFSNRNDKITVNAKVVRNAIAKGYNVTNNMKVHSKGQKLDVKLDQHFAVSATEIDVGSMLSYTDKNQKPKATGARFSFTPQSADLYVYIPGKEIIRAATTVVIAKNLQKLENTFSVLGNKAISANLEFKNYNSFQIDYGRKDGAKKKIVVNGKIVLGQLAQIHADAYKDGAKQELFHLLIHLEENKFTKPDFVYNNKNIIDLVNCYRELLTERAKEAKQVGEDIAKEIVTEVNDLIEHLKKSQPNLKPLITYFEGELTKLKSELHADLTVKEINDIFNNTLGGLVGAVVESMKKLVEHVDELRQHLTDIMSKLQEAVKATYPQLKESFDKLFQVSLAIFDSATRLATAYVEAILKVLNEHQKGIEELVSVASELVQDVAKIVYKGASQIEKEVKEFVQLLAQQLRALPVYEVAQNMYRELVNYRIPDYILASAEEFCNNIKTILPTQELRDLFATLYNCVIKHAKHETVDYSSEGKKLYSQAWNAVHSILALLQSHATAENVFGFLETRTAADLSYLRKLPGLSSVKFSVLRLLANRELPSVSDLYHTYRPIHHIEDSIPPAKKYGYFTDGGFFVTYDGKQFVLPGTCRYVLARDAKDGNFTVVGEYVNGKLESVSLTEPGESVTIKANGNLLVNNKPADYPANTSSINAFFTGPLRKVISKYGVKLVCSVGTSTACYVRVSGFYHARLRGLLGDANNEPFDDFVLPNGNLAAGLSDFGNAYKLDPSCGAAAAKEAEAPRSAVCTKYFAGKASLSPCFSYVDPRAYRASCDQLAADGLKSGPCLVASSYAAACLVQNIFVSLPNDCIQCKVGDQLVNGGDTFSVKIPKNHQADIVIVVEQEADNEKAFKEFIKPVITELRNELKQHGITDVFIGLIGFGENLKWPRHYSSNNNVNIEGGDFSNMLFTDTRERLVPLQEAKDDKEGQKKLKYLKQRLDVELGTFKISDAYETAIRYPFRPTAAKAVVGLISLPCEKSPLSPFSLQDYRLFLGKEVYTKLGLTYYHVSPMKDLEISGKPQKNVVGYDKDYVYTLADSKKKPLEGSAELRKNLALTGKDVCANFAVTTGGAAFSTHNFLEAKPNQQAQYVKVAARRIAENLASTEIEQDCVCGAEAHYGYTAQVVSRSHCKVVHREDKRHKPSSKP